ncbi:MAG TPA: tetratricopeptide repeat protein [Gemmatimonadaceae bacterium]|nr:tetratricopeptide repeat protein [Gemmatimonadaceae bacterium]
MRLIDSYVETGASIDPANWAQLHSVRAAIEDINDGDPVRGVLAAVLEDASKRATIDEVVCGSLLLYGRALDYEASWTLATDVFSTVAKLARPERTPKLAVEANVLVGGSARRNGDWETSARAYSQAAYIADTVGDREGVLTVQVGIANTYMAKGNLPHAQTILDDVIVQAQDHELFDVQGIALHSRASLAARQGDYAEGLKLAYQALCHTRKPTQRDEVLEDIGAMFTGLGNYDAARDAHLILANTAQTKLVRWSASLNLMELASLDGQEPAFDSYARQLASEPLNTWIRSHYLLFLGEGFARFGRYDAAEDALREASAFAGANQIHQLSFQAQCALETLRSSPPVETVITTPARSVPPEVDALVRAMSDLRNATVAAP